MGASDSSGVYGKIIDESGVIVLGDFQINEYTTNKQYNAQILRLVNDNILITWESNKQDSDSYGLYGKIYSADMSVNVKSEFKINDYVKADQKNLQMLNLLNGNIFMVWNSNLQDGDKMGIYGKIIAATGEIVKAEFKIS